MDAFPNDTVFREVVDSVVLKDFAGQKLQFFYTHPLDKWSFSGFGNGGVYAEGIGNLYQPFFASPFVSLVSQYVRCYQDKDVFVKFFDKACDFRLSTVRDSFPFPNKNGIWTNLEYENFAIGDITVHYGMIGDTLINGLQYKKIYTSRDSVFNTSNDDLTYFGALRIEGNKALILPRFHVSFTEDLIYDSNFGIGDTLYNAGIATATIGTLLVKSIDSTVVEDNSIRRRWNFEYIYSSTEGVEYERGYAFSWIEGVGNTKCPFKEPIRCNFFTSPTDRLLCFETDRIKIYRDSLYPNCYYRAPVSTNEANKILSLHIFPNPTNAIINIENTDNFNGLAYTKITDINGKVVFEKDIDFAKSPQINIDHLPVGLYIIIIQNSSKVYLQKFIKIDSKP